MFLVTGSIGSGTTLVSKYMHSLGIRMMRGNSIIAEDPILFEFLETWNGKRPTRSKIDKLRDLIVEAEKTQDLWGFKYPPTLLYSCSVIDSFEKYTSDVEMIHVFRDFDENLECWMNRKPNHPITIEDATRDLLRFHTEAIRIKSWRQVHMVYIRDVIDHPYEFYKLLNIDKPYIPICEVLDPEKLQISNKKFPRDENVNYIFNLLMGIKWKP
jgi:hypothetical protein